MSSSYNSPQIWRRYGDNMHHPETDDSPQKDKCATWISVESTKVSAAFSDSDVELGIMTVRPWHKRPKYEVWCLTTLTDAKPEESIPIFYQPIQEGDSIDRNLDPRLKENGSQQNANGDSEHDPSLDKRWRIDGQGHLIPSDTLNTVLTTLKIAPGTPPREAVGFLINEKSEAVIRLAAEDRQLEALKLALEFARTATLGCTAELNFTAAVVLKKGYPYPTISLLISGWRPDTELQCFLAYYILREMLKLYRYQPFPDRVDVWEFGFEKDRLLVPYGEEADGETARVRRRIVEELTLEEQQGNAVNMEQLRAGLE